LMRFFKDLIHFNKKETWYVLLTPITDS